MSEEKLLPCPFCGGEGRLIKTYESGHGYCIDIHAVKCQKCGAKGGTTSTYRNESPEEELKKKAIDKWNMRR